jgi:hypothetical protein
MVTHYSSRLLQLAHYYSAHEFTHDYNLKIISFSCKNTLGNRSSVGIEAVRSIDSFQREDYTPRLGQEFASNDESYEFYKSYAQKFGFRV